MDNRLFLIDAMAFAFRAFHAIKSNLTDPKGRPTNAVYGFTRILLKILREHAPSHIAVVFDAPGGNFRDALYTEYKANRQETPPELREQFPRMHAVTEVLGLPLFCVPGVEADDVIATLSREATAKGIESVIVSGDKDLMQLINSQVRMFDPNKGESGVWYEEEAVRERFGVGPEGVPDALALIGDSADNVPGVRGIGDKTAKKIMEQYPSLEAIYENIEAFKGKQKEHLIADREQAFFSRVLVRLKDDVELPLSLEECRPGEREEERLKEAFKELGFTSLLGEVGLSAETKAEEKEILDYRLILSGADLDETIAALRAAGRFSVDTETTSTDPMAARLVGISLSCRAGSGWYIPVGHTEEALTIRRDPEDLLSMETLAPLPKSEVLERLRPILEDAGIGKIGHNIKYDMIVLAMEGIVLRGVVMDTMVASYLTDPSRMRHNLDEVSLHYLKRKTIPITDLIGKGVKAVTFDQVPVDSACVYAVEDADMAWRLAEVFAPLLRERGVAELFETMELPLIGVLARMEMAGITIDTEVLESLRTEIEGRLNGLAREIFELAGESFNINSPKQLQEILFGRLGLRTVRKTKTGQSTDVEVLEELAREHPLPEKILEYRTLEKLRGTYVEALPRMVNARTGRIHTSFNQAVTATGRLSSSDPNLQNIPVRTDLGRRIRAGFVPGGPELRLISADYSQIELRLLAHLSGDANLCAAFHRNEDIHRDTAARVFGVTAERVTPEMRRQAKAVNFGVVYGISDFGLSKNLGISRIEARRFIDNYFEQYPRIRLWLDEVMEKAHKDGYVTTLFQRRRYLPDISGRDAVARKAAERAAINTPVQGTAADVIKVAMVRLEEALTGTPARMLLQVHDELLVEAPAPAASEIAETMRSVMESAVTISVPLRVDIGIGQSWAEIH